MGMTNTICPVHIHGGAKQQQGEVDKIKGQAPFVVRVVGIYIVTK